MTDRYVSISSKMATIPASPVHYEGVSPEDIARAEQEVGAHFPGSYRWFLQTYGAAILAEFVYGLGPRVPGYLNVVSNTFMERNDVVPRMFKHLIPVSPDGFGNHWCLDTSRFTGDECPVVFWYHDRDNSSTPDIAAPTFLDWLEELVEEELESIGQ